MSSTFYDHLVASTARERTTFQQIPVIREAIQGRVDLPLYLRYLEQAYHHVRHTCPLMGAALARCTGRDSRYREALLAYLDEERGHEHWILDDIAALGGDRERVAAGEGNAATRIMVGYAYYAIEHISPYALLGMVHVLEGMSVALADTAAKGIAASIGKSDLVEKGDAMTPGFSYLRSHGGLDQDHVRFFETLVNGLPDNKTEDVVIDTARLMYRLFGDVFHSLTDEGASRYAA
ncbi:MAG: iron-containing redox enzyme family protein [Alphaproteobacteria bacterium]